MQTRQYSPKVMVFNIIGCLLLAVLGGLFISGWFVFAGLMGAGLSAYRLMNNT